MAATGSALNGDGLEELDGLDNMELINFLESSFRRSEFIRVARILKIREESSNADAVKNLSEELSLREASIAELRAKHGSLEKELEALRTEMKERVKKRGVESIAKIREIERKLMEEKDKYSALKGRYETMELAKAEALRCCSKYSKNYASVEGQVTGMKTDYIALKAKGQVAEEKIKSLLEEVQKYKEEKKKLIQIKDNNMVLECDNRVLQDEIDGVKFKYSEIELKEVAKQDLLKQKNDCSRLEEHVIITKSDYSALKAREQNAEEMFEILRVEAKWIEKTTNDRISEFEIEVKELEYVKRMLQDEVDAWKCKYLLLEGWILQFLKEHPVLVESVREEAKNDQKQNGNICRSKEISVSDTSFDIKESFVPTSIKSRVFIDISRNDMDIVSGASSLEGTYNVTSRKISEMKNSVVKYFDAAGSNKNCCKRKFQLEGGDGNGKGRSWDAADNYDDGDDAIPTSKLKMKSLVQGKKEKKCASESCPIVCNSVRTPPTPCNRSSGSLGKYGRDIFRSKDGTTEDSAIL